MTSEKTFFPIRIGMSAAQAVLPGKEQDSFHYLQRFCLCLRCCFVQRVLHRQIFNFLPIRLWDVLFSEAVFPPEQLSLPKRLFPEVLPRSIIASRSVRIRPYTITFILKARL